MALSEMASVPGLHVRATEPGILGPQGIELTLQDDDAVTERCEASVHGELPALKDGISGVGAARPVVACSREAHIEVVSVAAERVHAALVASGPGSQAH